MQENYFELNKQDQKAILKSASMQLNKTEHVLEKDIWVCWALEKLFSMPEAHPMAFKGGTSLSKVYNIINRFSEDIDITLDYRHFDKTFDPFGKNVSNNQMRKFSDLLKSHVKEYCYNTIVPYFKNELKSLPNSHQYEVKVDDTGEQVWISYQSVTAQENKYLKPEILIEFGGRNVIDPNEKHYIEPDVAAITQGVIYPKTEAIILSPARTFWEKATLIHVECNRNTFKQNSERLSRHWYDLAKLAAHAWGQSAINNRVLLADVIQHKKAFFNTSYANYDACLIGKFQLIPDEQSLYELYKDYQQMVVAGMIYEEIDFGEIFDSIFEIEKLINASSL
ncbi:MAG: nucleotidyl transferase AbiEii/AbiGii toxin family protein [Legionellales bacterium]|jgi:hypothetical protein